MNKNLKKSLQFVVGAAYTAKDLIKKGVQELKKEEVLDETKSKKVFKKTSKDIKNKLSSFSKAAPKETPKGKL